jgi:hypothetical protein
MRIKVYVLGKIRELSNLACCELTPLQLGVQDYS